MQLIEKGCTATPEQRGGFYSELALCGDSTHSDSESQGSGRRREGQLITCSNQPVLQSPYNAYMETSDLTRVEFSLELPVGKLWGGGNAPLWRQFRYL